MSTVESVMGNSNAFDSNVYTEWALLLYLFDFVYMDLFVAIHVFGERRFLERHCTVSKQLKRHRYEAAVQRQRHLQCSTFWASLVFAVAQSLS